MTLHEQTTQDLKRQVAEGVFVAQEGSQGRSCFAPPPLRAHPRVAGPPRLDGSFGRAVRFGTFFVATTKLTTPRSRTRLPDDRGLDCH